jgi:tRNA uridine 5-carbamoylmethylation protein Kti12
MSNQEPKTPITESLVREVISSYNSLKGKYRLDAPIFLTVDEIIEQITKDLNQSNVKNQR